jgi:hypothetical protein
MTNMTMVVEQVIDRIKTDTDFRPGQELLKDALFVQNVGAMASYAPLLGLILVDEKTIVAIQTICRIAYETGRMVGQQEVIDGEISNIQ